jgi:hypothetical protein
MTVHSSANFRSRSRDVAAPPAPQIGTSAQPSRSRSRRVTMIRPSWISALGCSTDPCLDADAGNVDVATTVSPGQRAA